MASPQPHPFVRFSKELYDALLRAPLSGGQRAVCELVVRVTYGDRGRRQAAVSLGMLERATGRSRSAVKEALDQLIAEGVLLELRPPASARPRILAVNKDYQAWGRFSVDPADIPEFLRHDWEEVCGEDTYLPAAPKHAAVPLPPVPAPRTESCRPAAPTKEETPKTKTGPSLRQALLAAPTEVDWQQRADELLAGSAYAAELRRLAEIMASENKTGRVRLRRVVVSLYEPLTALEKEIAPEAMRYGLEAALAASAPNANYVKKAAASYRGSEQPLPPTMRPSDAFSYNANFLTDGAHHD